MHALVDVALRVHVPLFETALEFVVGWRRQKNEDRFLIQRLDCARAVHLGFENEILAAAQRLVDKTAWRAIQVSRVLTGLKELAGGRASFEFVPIGKMIVYAFDFVLSRFPCGNRYAVCNVGFKLPQPLDDRVLAGTGRSGDDQQDAATGASFGQIRAPLANASA